MEDSNICAVAIEHLQGEEKVLSLVTVRYEEGFGSAVVLPIQVQLLHVLESLFDDMEKSL